MGLIDSLKLLTPEIITILGAFLLLFLDFSIKNKKILGYIALGALALAAFFIQKHDGPLSLFSGFFVLDGFSYLFRYVSLAIVGITILISLSFKEGFENEGEFYSLFLFMAFGLTLMATSTNLLMIFIAIEFVSILSYVMVGYRKHDPYSKEAAVKYLLFGSLASGLMLLGMSFMFGLSGSLDLSVIAAKLSNPAFAPMALTSTILFLAGVGFKVSMAPFHLWAPDVYQGAPTPVTAFLTVGPKALGFVVLIRLLSAVYPALGESWSHIIAVLAMLTMTLGNLTAIAQTNIKRLLAFSSVAQAGYILMGIASASSIGISAVMVYLIAYALTNLGVFTIVILVSNETGDDKIESYTGLSKRSPFMAAALVVFLLSLAGIPPLAGFIGKFYVFSAAIQSGLITLAIVAALNSAVAAYYYFRIVRLMYLVPSTDEHKIPKSAPVFVALLLMLIGTVAIGLMPAPLIAWIQSGFII